MTLSLNIGGTGTFRNILKYNAKEGRWYLRSGDDESEIESPTMVIDLANIATGWYLFLEGKAPNRVIDPSLEFEAPQPSESHKRGFMVLVFSTKHLNGVAEMSSCSMHMCNAIGDIYKAFAAQRGDHPGKLPVVACTGTVEKPGKFGTNYKPTFEIIDWADRPDDLPDESPADPSEVWHGAAAASIKKPTPTETVAKPAADAEALYTPYYHS